MERSKESESSKRKTRKLALGRGLDALIPDISTAVEEPKTFFFCDMDLIHPNRYQPRILFSEDELVQLSQSIREKGVIQPLLVRRDGAGYEIVAGERRFRAAKLAGLDKIPVILKPMQDEDLLETSIIENIQRENLNPMEEAQAYHRLMTQFQLTQEEVSTRVGKSRPTIANLLRLLLLPDEIRTLIMKNALSMGHARALLGAETPAAQIKAARLVISKRLSVRETESLINRMKSERKRSGKKERKANPVYISDLEDSLSRRFGTRVRIIRQGKKGTVEIDFFSDDDLDRIIRLIHS
ncbi:MAG: ParB/RepB/Spo0J family partition protein [Thermodesulfobacteriota bacterium]